jgi:hypothetical protein
MYFWDSGWQALRIEEVTGDPVALHLYTGTLVDPSPQLVAFDNLVVKKHQVAQGGSTPHSGLVESASSLGESGGNPKEWMEVVFLEEFDGTSLDPGRWEVHENDGTITLAGGSVTLQSPGASFPYLLTAGDPFPPGNFVITVGMRYTSAAELGVGFVADSGRPVNGQPPHKNPATQELAGVWQDTSSNYHLFTFFAPLSTFVGAAFNPGTSSIVGAAPELTDHVYEFEYDDPSRAISASVDGSPVGTSPVAVDRPAALWLGNPSIAAGAWSSVSIDFIQIARKRRGRGGRVDIVPRGDNYLDSHRTLPPEPRPDQRVQRRP